jgi:hypothetical protein
VGSAHDKTLIGYARERYPETLIGYASERYPETLLGYARERYPEKSLGYAGDHRYLGISLRRRNEGQMPQWVRFGLHPPGLWPTVTRLT